MILLITVPRDCPFLQWMALTLNRPWKSRSDWTFKVHGSQVTQGLLWQKAARAVGGGGRPLEMMILGWETKGDWIPRVQLSVIQ